MVMEIFHSLTDLVEPLSLDEAYLDITGPVEAGQAPLAVALDLKRRVQAETGLILSVGVATSKSVAKIASDMGKPDGLTRRITIIVIPTTRMRWLACSCATGPMGWRKLCCSAPDASAASVAINASRQPAASLAHDIKT